MTLQEIQSKVLLRLTEKDNWTIDDALKGTSIIGGTGSGKTSSSGREIAISFLKKGFGGIVLCAKTDEAGLWEKYCRKTGRLNDLIIFGKGSKNGEGEDLVFNPIDYEMKRSGEGAGETQNITNIFMNIYRMGNRIASEGDTKEERYWDTALKRCLNRTIELIKLAGEDLSYTNMVKVVSTAHDVNRIRYNDALTVISEKDELPDDNDYCLKCLCVAFKNHHNELNSDGEIANSYNLVEDYFTIAMPKMGDKTKSVVTESFMGLAEPFLQGLLYKHFSGKNNILLEETYTKNKIIVLNFPIKEFLDAGIMAQSIFKLLFQQAVERRNTDDFPTPVFLWCDEAQYFVNPYDQIFLTTARGSRAATVFLSQNISNYFAVMGSGSDAKARVDSLMGNLSTKIFHANSDAETNEYASRLIGNELMGLAGASNQHRAFSLIDNYTNSTGTQFLPQVQPKEFTTLSSGGEATNFETEAFVMVNGRKWVNGANFLKIPFRQDFKE